MDFVQYNKDSNLRGYDMIFVAFKDFMDSRPVHFPKITGDWKIALVDLKYDEMEQAGDYTEQPFQKITVFVKKEFLVKSGKFRLSQDVKPYDEFLKDQIANFPFTIDSKAASAIYRRCKSKEERQELLDELVNDGIEHVTVKDVDAIKPENSIVYTSDAVAMILLPALGHIPKRGSIMSKYAYMKYSTTLDKFLEDMGIDFAFYSLRKNFRQLLENKIKYLHNTTLDIPKVQMELIRKVDVYTLYYIVILFNTSKPKSLLACLADVNKRLSGKGKLLEESI